MSNYKTCYILQIGRVFGAILLKNDEFFVVTNANAEEEEDSPDVFVETFIEGMNLVNKFVNERAYAEITVILKNL